MLVLGGNRTLQLKRQSFYRLSCNASQLILSSYMKLHCFVIFAVVAGSVGWYSGFYLNAAMLVHGSSIIALCMCTVISVLMGVGSYALPGSTV